MEDLTAEELKLLETKPSYLTESQKRERIRLKNRIAKRRQREHMTEDEKQRERKENSDRIKKIRKNQTFEQLEEDRQKARERMRRLRKKKK